MKNTFLKLIFGAFSLAFTACSTVQFYSNSELTKKSGIKYYTVKPCLQVERDVVNNNIVKATILYLPDLENPQYIKIKNGIGSQEFDLKLIDGSISTFGVKTDQKIAETIEALTSMISKTASAVTDRSGLKGIPATAASGTVTELYDIIMTNGFISVRKIEVK